LLIDSDFFVLLSAAGFLEQGCDLLGYRLDATRRNPALDRQLSNGRKWIQKYSQKVRTRVLVDCLKVTPLTDRPRDPAVEQKLAEAQDIDIGEAVMFGLMVKNPEYMMASGDKRAIRSLATDPKLKSISKSLSGRIYCFEEVLDRLVRHLGVRPVAAAYGELLKDDGVLARAFREGDNTNQSHCIQVIDFYRTQLIKDVGTSFLAP